MSKYLIYGLRCPKTDEYRYIGKSSSGLIRAKSHLTFSHNASVNYWVAELREFGLCPLVDILEECSEDDLLTKEKFWIKFYQDAGCRLMNEILYRGSGIEKLQKEIIKEEEKLKKRLYEIQGQINDISEIHTFIKYRRKQLKLTQPQLAELAKVSHNTLYKIEKKDRNITIHSLSKILDVLGYRLSPVFKNVS